MNKTMIGKDNYLFLHNDSSKELEIHCNNLNLINDIKLSSYNKYRHKFFTVIYPGKCLIHKKYLPHPYNPKYRPGLQIYKKVFNNKLLDAYEYLKNEDDVYYKTDTHINLKGNYIVYKKFIEKINQLYNLDLIIEHINIEVRTCVLSDLSRGIGDLTWETNLGKQKLNDINDNYYFSNDLLDFSCCYVIKNENNIRFLTSTLNDETLLLENKIVGWDIFSNYIIYKKNNDRKHKIIIFYDSFLINILPLYLNLFNEVYLIKNVYSNNLIDLINPDYVFEFRAERFLR
jgi:hypothetical protein